MSVFTKADIEIETFTESRKRGESIENLYAHLEELKSNGIYVVDVTPQFQLELTNLLTADR